MIKLFDGETTNTSSDGFYIRPGTYGVHVFGDLDGGTITLQGSGSDTSANYATLGDDGVFTAAGVTNIQAGGGMYVRATMAGATETPGSGFSVHIL
jgi:hypothetical protein